MFRPGTGVPSMGYILGGMEAQGKTQGLLKRDENLRANTKVAWEQEDRDKEEEILKGMSIASQNGGYNGVIDYLKTVNPERAIKLEKFKTGLDRDIMENDTYKLAHTNDKAKVMIEGYELLGRTAASIFKAPEGDRDAMYQAALPIIQQVNPNAPSSYSGGQNMLMLALGQAMPENQIFADKKQIASAQSSIGKLQADIDSRVARGETLENSRGLNNLMNAMEGENFKVKQLGQKVEDFDLKKQLGNMAESKDIMTLEKNKQGVISSINSRYEKSSKAFTEYLGTSNKVQAAFDVLAQDPNNAAALQTLQGGIAKMNAGPGVLSDQDFLRFATSTGTLSQAYKKLQSMGTGNVVPLNAQEVQNIKQVYGAMENSFRKQQNQTNQYYQDQLDKAGMPRTSIKMINSAPPQAIQFLQNNPTTENMQMFKQKYGYDYDLNPNLGN